MWVASKTSLIVVDDLRLVLILIFIYVVYQRVVTSAVCFFGIMADGIEDFFKLSFTSIYIGKTDLRQLFASSRLLSFSDH